VFRQVDNVWEKHAVSIFRIGFILKREAACSSETFAFTYNTT
jgi:hypothetical protein